MSRRVRGVGWGLSVVLWAVASDARPLLALLSMLPALAIRGAYIIVSSSGPDRSAFWSPWFFAVAALCELVWLFALSNH